MKLFGKDMYGHLGYIELSCIQTSPLTNSRTTSVCCSAPSSSFTFRRDTTKLSPKLQGIQSQNWFFKLLLLQNSLIVLTLRWMLIQYQINVRFISYSKSPNWCRISKLLSNFGCLFTFCYLDGANSIKTYIHICNL